MGNSLPQISQIVTNSTSSDEVKRALSKYTSNEQALLASLFRSLAKRSPGKTMDKATFTDLFNLPGIMGERLFKAFDKDKDAKIDWEEFVTGVAAYSRGTMDEKIRVLFAMYDLNGENSVNREELAMEIAVEVALSLGIQAVPFNMPFRRPENGDRQTMLYSLMTPTSSLLLDAVDDGIAADVPDSDSLPPYIAEEDEELHGESVVEDFPDVIATASPPPAFSEDADGNSILVAAAAADGHVAMPTAASMPVTVVGVGKSKGLSVVESANGVALPGGGTTANGSSSSTGNIDQPVMLSPTPTRANTLGVGHHHMHNGTAVTRANTVGVGVGNSYHHMPNGAPIRAHTLSVGNHQHMHGRAINRAQTPPMARESSQLSRRVDELVAHAFLVCDLDRNGLLSYEQFSSFINQKPEILQTMEFGMASAYWSDPKLEQTIQGSSKQGSPEFLGGQQKQQKPASSTSSKRSSPPTGLMKRRRSKKLPSVDLSAGEGNSPDGPSILGALSVKTGLAASSRASQVLATSPIAEHSAAAGGHSPQHHTRPVLSRPPSHSSLATFNESQLAAAGGHGGVPAMPVPRRAQSCGGDSLLDNVCSVCGAQFIHCVACGSRLIHDTRKKSSNSSKSGGSPLRLRCPARACTFTVEMKHCHLCGSVYNGVRQSQAHNVRLPPSMLSVTTQGLGHHTGSVPNFLPRSPTVATPTAVGAAAAAGNGVATTAAAKLTAADHAAKRHSIKSLLVSGARGDDASQPAQPPLRAGTLLKRKVRLGPLHQWVSRYFVLRGFFLYSYKKQGSTSADRVYFICTAWVSRYFVLRGFFLYSYKKQGSTSADRVYFIQGSFVKENDQFARDGYYGLHIIDPDVTEEKENSSNVRALYSKSAEDRNAWIDALRKAAKTVPFETFYRLGRDLGKGHFSRVREATHIESNQKFAVKIIEKSKMDAAQRDTLRTEIAILKLVRHPNIVSFADMFETPKKIFIVMGLVNGGDLFDRIQLRRRFSEDNARKLIWNILDALMYLHARGIVHRDLKPENILCMNEDDDTNILISDFGLSRFATGDEIMSMPCGTLSYVAPEVLNMQGYSRSVDVWSIGCITFLLLRGALPFDAKTKEEIIANTLHRKVHFDRKWDHVSIEARGFVTQLLQKDPTKRLTLEGAVKHKWFDGLTYRERSSLRHSMMATPRMSRSPSTTMPQATPTLFASHSIAVTTAAASASVGANATGTNGVGVAKSAKSAAGEVPHSQSLPPGAHTSASVAPGAATKASASASSSSGPSSGPPMSSHSRRPSSPAKPTLANQKPPSTFAKRGSVSASNPASPEVRQRELTPASSPRSKAAASVATAAAAAASTSASAAVGPAAGPAASSPKSSLVRPVLKKSTSESPATARKSSLPAGLRTQVAFLRRRSSSSPQVAFDAKTGGVGANAASSASSPPSALSSKTSPPVKRSRLSFTKSRKKS